MNSHEYRLVTYHNGQIIDTFVTQAKKSAYRYYQITFDADMAIRVYIDDRKLTYKESNSMFSPNNKIRDKIKKLERGNTYEQ